MKICDICEREMHTIGSQRKRHATCKKPLTEEQKLTAKLRQYERLNARDIERGQSITNRIGASARSQRRMEEAQRAA